MPSKSRIALHVVGACLAVAGLGAVATPAVAAPATTHATTPVCSAPRSDGNYVCITLDSASSPSTATATLYDEPNGRGWLGKVEIDGPNGQLGLSPEEQLGKGGSYTYSVPGDGNGQYCAIDYIWYVYTGSFVEQSSACVTAA
jgi:hypothetical protein